MGRVDELRLYLQTQARVFKSDWVKLQVDAPVVNIIAALDSEEAGVGSRVV